MLTRRWASHPPESDYLGAYLKIDKRARVFWQQRMDAFSLLVVSSSGEQLLMHVLKRD